MFCGFGILLDQLMTPSIILHVSLRAVSQPPVLTPPPTTVYDLLKMGSRQKQINAIGEFEVI